MAPTKKKNTVDQQNEQNKPNNPDNEQDLENYRLSKTFGEIWPMIKPWFAKSAEAWTVEAVYDGFSLKKG
jgi:hypothetical protein